MEGGLRTWQMDCFAQWRRQISELLGDSWGGGGGGGGEEEGVLSPPI